MSDAVINRNPDLKRLQDEGYEIEVSQGYAIIHHIPYLDEHLLVKYGVLVSALVMAGEKVTYRNEGINHVVYFQGDMPYRANGAPFDAVVNSPHNGIIAGVSVNWMFSSKPQGGYKDYYDKFTNYIRILSAEAQNVDPDVTAKTFRRVVTNEKSVFCYEDTNASRGAITDVSSKLRNQKVGIIGLGGTGSYILDQIAKTPVDEIHLYDGDVFCQHNAFRAPGAPGVEVFEKQPHKTDYFAQLYSRMHKGIFSHPNAVTAENIAELQSFDFVFLAMDSGENKRIIIEYLIEHHVRFVDTGIDVSRTENALFGMVRDTVCRSNESQDVKSYISFAGSDKDLYAGNIQISDLNALCAVIAVIEWKKLFGFYVDNVNKCNCVYTTNNGEITWQ